MFKDCCLVRHVIPYPSLSLSLPAVGRLIRPNPPPETLFKVDPLRPALRAVSALTFCLSISFPSGSGAGFGGGGGGSGGGAGLGGGGEGAPPPGNIDIIVILM